MKINTSTPINSLDGTPIRVNDKPLTVGRMMSDILSTDPNNVWKPLKSLAVAQRFYSGEVIDLDEGDLSDLRQIIEDCKTRSPLVLGRILQVLIESKDKEKK